MTDPQPNDSASEEDVLEFFTSLSNWGRWGSDDQRGTLNLLPPDAALQAAGLVRTGTTVSCARPLAPRPAEMPALAMLHMMTSSGEAAPEEGMASGTDWIGLGMHGFEFTHVDAHSHVFWNRKMYNDRPASLCTTERGALAGGIEPLASGVVGRGIFIDGPTIRSREWMGPGDGLMPAELDDWFVQIGLEPRPGDLLFVRTGRDAWEAAGDSEITHHTLPGLDASCLPWLHSNGIAILVSDVIHDALPSPYARIPFPIHCVGIVAMGLWLVDNAALGMLSRVCVEQDRFAFFASFAPEPFRRATGSLVNPLAVF